jgi:hypothetical protein
LDEGIICDCPWDDFRFMYFRKKDSETAARELVAWARPQGIKVEFQLRREGGNDTPYPVHPVPPSAQTGSSSDIARAPADRTYPLRVRLGGTFNPGRHLAVGSQPIANVWLTMLNSVGINATSFGNSIGALSLT